MASKHKVFKNPSPKQAEELGRRARLQYDPAIMRESAALWASYDEAQKKTIMDQGNHIYARLADTLEAGHSPHSPEAQEVFQLWEDHLHYFYTPSPDILRGLGQTYNTDPAFMANFQKLHPDLPAFLEAGISFYVDQLEEAELRRLIADDENASAAQAD
jgi:hypothetical protein